MIYQLPDTNINPYKQALWAVCRHIRLHNDVSLINIQREILQATAARLQQRFSLAIVNQSRDEFINFVHGKNCTIGVFEEKCCNLKRHLDDMARTAPLLADRPKTAKEAGREALAAIKAHLVRIPK